MAAPNNPKGAKSDKLWREAIMLAVHEEDEATGRKKLRALAEKLRDRALEGDVTALKEIGDRLDGKPAQTIAGDPENPLNIIGRLTWAKPE